MDDAHDATLRAAQESLHSFRDLMVEALPTRNEQHQGLLLRLVLNAVGDGIVATNETGHIVYCNPAMSDILGYAPGELLGQYVGLILAPEDRPAHRKAFHNFVGRLRENELHSGGQAGGKALTKNGQEIEMRSRVYGVFSGGEVVIIAFFEPMKTKEEERQ